MAKRAPFPVIVSQLLETHEREVAELVLEVASLRSQLASGQSQAAEQDTGAKPGRAPIPGQLAPRPRPAVTASANQKTNVRASKPQSGTSHSDEIGGAESDVGAEVATSDRSMPDGAQGPAAEKHLFESGDRHPVTGPIYELIFAAFVMLNTAVIACEIQYQGWELGLSQQFEDAEGNLVGHSPRRAFDICDWFFFAVFTIELLFNLVGYRLKFLKHAWHWFDGVLVLLWTASKVLGAMGSTIALVSVGRRIQFVRFARLARLHRRLACVRHVQGIDALYLMITALTECWPILLWAVCLLTCCEVVVAMCMFYIVENFYLRDETAPFDERHQVFLYFGTFTRSVFSMFELIFGNWIPIARALSENVSQWFMLLTVVHKVTMGFAALSVVNGVFIRETFRVADTDDQIMVRQKDRALATHRAKMVKLFKEADSSGDGILNLSEFCNVMANEPDLKIWLASMEIDVSDLDRLYRLIDNGDEKIGVDELIRGVSTLRGAARSLDMRGLLIDVATMRQDLESIRQNLYHLRFQAEVAAIKKV